MSMQHECGPMPLATINIEHVNPQTGGIVYEVKCNSLKPKFNPATSNTFLNNRCGRAGPKSADLSNS